MVVFVEQEGARRIFMPFAQTSIAELLSTGITLNTDEAVAIARALATDRTGSPAGESHEPLLLEDVCLGPDGTVVCRGCGETAHTLSEVALFLRELLPIGTAGIPGGLHYMIARALLEVDAPPFDSLEDFSDALARFEPGDRRQLLRELLARAQTNARFKSRSSIARRRVTSTSIDDLRAALHAADARLLEQKLAMEKPATAPPPQPRRWMVAVAACLTGASALCAGDAISRHFAAPSGSAATSTSSKANTQGFTVPTAGDVRAVQAADIVLSPPLAPPKVASTPNRTVRTSGRVSSKPTLRKTPPRSTENRSLLKRLRLDWIRKPFTRT
jgi:hypothetical protein